LPEPREPRPLEEVEQEGRIPEEAPSEDRSSIRPLDLPLLAADGRGRVVEATPAPASTSPSDPEPASISADVGAGGLGGVALTMQPRRIPQEETVVVQEEPGGAVPASSPEAGVQETPQHFEPMPDRWSIDGNTLLDTPYVINKGKSPWDPYNLNTLKGDYPIFGQDVFLNLELQSFSLVESRKVPTPSGNTGPGPRNEDFWGNGDQFVFLNTTALEVELFKGQQFFKPVDWRLRLILASNVTYLDVEETGVVNINPDDGTDRWTGDLSLEEAFLEVHILDWNDRYDFLAVEAGILEFRSDFRGFIFDDINLGVRLFGNADDNKWQYNFAWFHLLEKDSNSELNTFVERDQDVFIANLYRFDWPIKGINQSISFHYSHDQGNVHFNDNDFLVRPAPIGSATPHEIDTYYLGYAVDGHIGRLNISGAFYQVWGTDSENPIAAREVSINAQLAALELSVDFDWIRLKAYAFYGSGDSDSRNSRAEGFDAIVDAPNFAGGEFSYWNRQGIPLFGTFLTNRLSPLADLQSTKFEGQASFVNPGVLIIGLGTDVEVTPTLRLTAALQHIRLADTSSLETLAELEGVDKDIGFEALMGIQYRPLLTNNIILTVGGAVLRPGSALEKIYESDDYLWHAFVEMTLTW
jgi:hypothetical protein